MRPGKYRISKLFVSFAFVLTLCACATAPSATPEQLASVGDGQQSAIIMSYQRSMGFPGGSVGIENLNTGESYNLIMRTDEGGEGRYDSALIVVPPGTYRIVGGGVSSSSAWASLPLLRYWFDPFEVEAGEAVDLGTLSAGRIQARSLPPALGQFFNTLFTLRAAETSAYVVYNISDAGSGAVQDMLEREFPDLGVAPQRRPLTLRLDEVRFAQLIFEAYAANSDGTLPSTQDAQARLGELLQAYLRDTSVANSAAAPVH